MMDYVNLGSSPIEEDCVQVSSEHEYLQAMKAECQRYKEMLEKRFPWAVGMLKIKTFPHDFGSYMEICAVFDDQNESQTALAFFMEDNCPMRWDDAEVVPHPV